MKNPNLLPLEEIASAITEFTGWETSIEFPYFLFIKEKGINFGHSLDGGDYYSWNDEDGRKVGKVLPSSSAEEIAKELVISYFSSFEVA